MNQNAEGALERAGWTLECESPLEIRQGESFASNQAAKLAIEAIRADDAIEASQIEFETESGFGKPHDGFEAVILDGYQVGRIELTQSGYIFFANSSSLLMGDLLRIAAKLRLLNDAAA